MKKSDIPRLEEQILKMLPTPQRNIWKTLNIDSRDCSVILKIMVDKKLVGRVLNKGEIVVETYNASKHENSDNSPGTRKGNEKKLDDISRKLVKILPALQSEIWKKLGIERRQCSRLMQELEEKSLIKRTKEGGTFMVENIGIGIEEVKPIKKTDFSVLLSDSGKFSPCVGCEEKCNPALCNSLTQWIMDIKV